ncbi:MAG TPA: glycosyltransferase family 2 protein [Bacteriovoracaceae bacterium]|nr:glycosyltransferase family 2 protein [Bacteriovoracaceae bacterium]
MLSLIIPIYRNEEGIAPLITAIEGLARQCQSELDSELKVTFVVDGSPDRSFEVLREMLGSARFSSTLVSLSRNYGSFAAIRAGLNQAEGRSFAVMSADLQEPIELVFEFFKSLEAGLCDVVVGARTDRKDPLFSKFSSNLFWRLYRKFIIKDLPNGGVDIFGCNETFRKELLQLEESNSSIVGLIFWLGFRRLEIPYTRRQRQVGKSGWTFSKKVNYMLDSLFSFTDLPIKALILFGITGISVSVLLGIVVIVSKFFDIIKVPGFSTLAVVISFFGGINALGIGIIGNYTWRAYENTKKRPLYVISKKVNYQK